MIYIIGTGAPAGLHSYYIINYILMNKAISPPLTEVLQAEKYRPCVSVQFPFEPKMMTKPELEAQVKRISQQVKKELQAAWPTEAVEKVMAGLQELFKKLDYATYKKSAAVFVSPVFKKVYQLNIELEERITIDASFEIRDLLYSKKIKTDFLLLVISTYQSKIFLSTARHFQTVSQLHAEQRDLPERVPAFDEPGMMKLAGLEKFMLRVDRNLGLLLRNYSVPLFVMGTKKTVGHFKKMSRQLDEIVEYIYGNYENATEDELKKIMAPYIGNWQQVQQKKLLQQLDAAMGAHKLVFGMKEVWKECSRGAGQLLVVEKNYRCAARYGKGSDDIIQEDALATQNNLFIKDAVDDVIEKVLHNGGDVEFVDDGLLKAFAHIALIKYYR